MEVYEYKGNNGVLKHELETYKKKEGFRSSRNDRIERSEWLAF